MRLDVWADLVCPWCYIGKRRLERALAEFPHTEDVEMFFRSFQLDPRAPVGRTRLQVEVLVERYGMSEARALALESETARTAEAEGLEFRFEGALTGNTFDAHRLVHLARARGKEGAVVDRFYRAQFAEQRSLFEKRSLVELAAEAGLDPCESQTALDQGAYAEAVLAGCPGGSGSGGDRGALLPLGPPLRYLGSPVSSGLLGRADAELGRHPPQHLPA